MTEYIVLCPDAYVEYNDGTHAEDYVVIGIVSAEAPDVAVTKAVEDISPMSEEFAEDTEFLVWEVDSTSRRYEYYEADE